MSTPIDRFAPESREDYRARHGYAQVCCTRCEKPFPEHILTETLTGWECPECADESEFGDEEPDLLKEVFEGFREEFGQKKI